VYLWDETATLQGHPPDPLKCPPLIKAPRTVGSVPVTGGLIVQLYHRRRDLTATNLDRAEALDDTMNLEAIAALRAGITIDRLAIHALDRVFGEYARATEA
jgi:hypothetical protein